MIISDMSYLEIEVEASALEGGVDLGLNWTHFLQKQSVLQTASMSSPAGSVATTSGGTLKIDTSGLALIGLNLP